VRTTPLCIVLLAIGCSGTPAPVTVEQPEEQPPTAEQALEFLAEADRRIRELADETHRMYWVYSTYINDDTEFLKSKMSVRGMQLDRWLAEGAAKYSKVDLPADQARLLHLLRVWSSAPSPNDPDARQQLADVSTGLQSSYATRKVCLEGDAESCLSLGDINRTIASSRDYDELLKVWVAWRDEGASTGAAYEQFVTLVNQGAREVGFADAGELWRSRYDMPADEFAAEAERLWLQIRPLYEKLHCHVRTKLSAHYGADKVPLTGPIPAHVLGNNWAQDWGNIYPLVEPYPGSAMPDITTQLVAKKWTPEKMARTAEGFFTSMGLKPLPDTFWERSMISQPRDRDVSCHPQAFTIAFTDDLRIKMCTEVTEGDLAVLHHELGHNYYYLYYIDQPVIVQDGAHDGFHEGIGDTLTLSMTPGYYQKLGLIDEAPTDDEAELNYLMDLALDRIAFVPFGLLVDKWRWQVFDGTTAPAEYNDDWWKLRLDYQGVASAVDRPSTSFDPGGKFHVPNNTPYIRYFLAHILMFQFHRALCDASGHTGPLHTCSIYGSKTAGERLGNMLAMGQSRPWPEALEALTGSDKMDGQAMLDYFAPLVGYLDAQNAGQQCGW
jgi:peptidyl-dipeptidase A